MISIYLASGGCNRQPKDMTTPQGAYAMYLNSIAESDGEATYALLKKEVRSEIDETLSNLKKTAKLIEENFPDVLKAGALAEYCPDDICRAENPGRFLQKMMKQGGGVKLSFTEQLGARIKKLYNDNGVVRIVTVAGDLYKFEKGGDGKYYYIPSDEDQKTIGFARIKSREALLKVEKEIEDLKKAAVMSE